MLSASHARPSRATISLALAISLNGWEQFLQYRVLEKMGVVGAAESSALAALTAAASAGPHSGSPVSTSRRAPLPTSEPSHTSGAARGEDVFEREPYDVGVDAKRGGASCEPKTIPDPKPVRESPL